MFNVNMSKKSAPIVFLNFSETESNFNVVNNAEEAEDNNYYKFVESEYDKLQVEKDPEKSPSPPPQPEKILPEEPPRKKRGRPKGSLNKKKKGDPPIIPKIPGIPNVASSSIPLSVIPPKKRGRKKKEIVEVKKPGRKRKKKREKKAYHFCDDDDDNDIGLEGEISDDEYIRRLEEQVHKEASETGSRREFGKDEFDSSSQEQDSGDEILNDDEVSTLEDQFTVCDEDIISYRSEGSETADTFIQNINSRLSVYAELDTEIVKNGPHLELPSSSNDLRCQNEFLMDTCATYEVLRRYGRLLRLSPFRFEDFLAAMSARENSVLLAEIHMCLLKAALREDDASATWINLPDQKDSVNISFYLNDFMSWPELLRVYVNSITEENDPSSALCRLEICNRYPFVDFRTRLRVLQHLTDQFLASSAVREEIIRENVIRYEDYCRICHKMGDLLCCDLCPAVFHLDCLDPPMSQVPRDEWHCPVCTQQQISGVTDVVSDGERRGVLHRHAPLGVDRHGRQYWFIARRLFVEAPAIDTDGCVSTQNGSSLWYYSCKEKYSQVLNSLSTDYEPALVEMMKEMKHEVFRQMEITRKLTEEKWLAHREKSNVSSAELLDEIAACERALNEAVHDQPGSGEGVPENVDDELSVDGADSAMVDQETGEKLAVGNEGSSASGYVTRSRTGTLPAGMREDGDYLVDSRGNLPTNEDELRDFMKRQDAQGDDAKKSGIFDLGERLIIITKDGQKFQLRKGRPTPIDKNTYELGLTGGFRLSDEGGWRKWINVYSSNQQEATSKQQFQEERDRRRFLSYKFSLTNTSTMEWMGDTNGSPNALLNSLRLTICYLETQLPSSFLCPRWREERKNWYVDLHRCITARQLIACLAKLEACIRPICLVNAWRDAIGHLELERITALSREEKKKAKLAERKSAKLKAQEQQLQNDIDEDVNDDVETSVTQTVYTKNPGQIKHRIWKMPGEEYRIVAGGGWFWLAKGWEQRSRALNRASLRSLARSRRHALLENQGLTDEEAPLGWGVLGDFSAGSVIQHPHRGSRFVLNGSEVVDVSAGLSQKIDHLFPDLSEEKPSSQLDRLLVLREAMEDDIKNDNNESISLESKENNEDEALSAEQKNLEELELLKKKRDELLANREQLKMMLSQEISTITNDTPTPRRGVRLGMKRGPYRKRRNNVPSEDSFSFASNTPKPTPIHSELPTPASTIKRSSYYATNDSDDDDDMELPPPRDKDDDFVPSSDEDGEDFLLPQVDGVVDSDTPAQLVNQSPQQIQLVSQPSSQTSTTNRPPVFMVKTASGQLVSLQMRSGVSTATTTTNSTASASGLRILRLPGGVASSSSVVPKVGNPRAVAAPLSGSLVVKKVAGRSSSAGVDDGVLPIETSSKNVASPTKAPISLPTSGVQTIKVVPGSLNQLSSLGNMRLVVRSQASSGTNPGASLIKTSPPSGSPQIATVRSLASAAIARNASGQKVPITALTLDQLRTLQQRRLQDHNVDLDSDEEASENRKEGLIANSGQLKALGLTTHKLQAVSAGIKSKSLVGSRPILPSSNSIPTSLNSTVKQLSANSATGQSKGPQFIRIAVMPSSGSGAGRQLVASAVNSSGQPILLQHLPGLTSSSGQLTTSTTSSGTVTMSNLQGGRRSLAKQQLSSMVPIPNAAPTVVGTGNSFIHTRSRIFQSRKEDSAASSLTLPGMGFGDSIRIRLARLEIDLRNTEEKIAAIEHKIVSRKRCTKDPVSIKRSRPSVSRTSLSSFKMPRSDSLPCVCDFLPFGSPGANKKQIGRKVHNLFRLDKDKLRILISKAGRVEVPGFHYEKKTAFMHWPYPGPRPALSNGWRYRLQTADSLFGVALQLRIMWHCLKWDDINGVPERFGIFKETKDGGTLYRRVIDIRYLDIYGVKCEVNVESRFVKQGKNGIREKTRSLDSDEEDPDANEEDSDPDFKPRSASRRRRKRRPVKRSFGAEDSDSNADQQEVSVSNDWLPDTGVELWEIRHYVETYQRLISTAMRSVTSDSLALNSRMMTTPNVSINNRAPVRATSLLRGRFEPVTPQTVNAKGKYIFANLDASDSIHRSVTAEAIPEEKKERGTRKLSSSRPKRSNAGMRMRQWQDDTDVANMLAAYDEGAVTPSETRQVRTPAPRSSAVSTVTSERSNANEVLTPYWRQSDSTSRVARKRPRASSSQEHRAEMAALRQKRQQLARIRKQICRRSRDLRAQMLEKRKLIETELQLQIEEEIHLLKEKQANELLERKAERKRKHHEKKMRKEMKRRSREGYSSDVRLESTPLPRARGRPPKSEPRRLGRPPMKHSSETPNRQARKRPSHLLLENPVKEEEVKLEPKEEPFDMFSRALSPGGRQHSTSPTPVKKARRSFLPPENPLSPMKKGKASVATPRKRLSSGGLKEDGNVKRRPGRPRKNPLPDQDVTVKKRGRRKSERENGSLEVKREANVEVKMEEEEEEEVYCICRQSYDPSRFYIGCDLCEGWFHGDCVNMSPKSARRVASWICPQCTSQQEVTQEELYCICRTPYDETKFYVACDSCNDWFHGTCVGLSEEEAADIDSYVCPKCIAEHKNKRGRVKTLYDHRIKGAMKSTLLSLLNELKVHAMAWPFLEPIDTTEEPNYLRIVETPMDLRTAESNLMKGKYKNIGHFVADIHLIFSNCRRYNPKDTPHFRCADVLETLFVKRMKAIHTASE